MSKIVKDDQLTNDSYHKDGFSAATATDKLSYTSARVSKYVYNRYDTSGKPKVFGYFTDWSQYDGRLDGSQIASSRGRGVNLANISPTAYDKIIIGFLGIVGDKGEKAATIATAAQQLNKTEFEVTFIDTWGDFLSSRNCNVDEGWIGDNPADVTQETVKGVLGGLRNLKDAASAKGHDLALSFSVGGWTMSNAFHETARYEASRKKFADSVAAIFEKYPMFSEVDIDWEYPGVAGNNNPYGEEDGANYTLLIAEVRASLDAMGRHDVKISIATSAVVDNIEKFDVQALLDAGLYGINLMTYDFFGTPWAETLHHHSNIYGNTGQEWCIDAAVRYLTEKGISSERINIGYAAYSRNAKNAAINAVSPLKGSYTPGSGITTGTFESGTSEFYDILYNYIDLEGKQDKNGFTLYTDEISCADFLYNKNTQLFISVDTPRTVKEKAAYALSHNLGGLFTWTIDLDNGLLVNAAREGFECPVTQQVIDMAPFYYKGETTFNVEQENAPPEAKITLSVVSGSVVQLSSEQSSDPDGDNISCSWGIPNGIVADGRQKNAITFIAPKVVSSKNFTFTLTVTDATGNHSTPEVFVVRVLESADTTEPPVEGNYAVWDSTAIYTGGEFVSWKGGDYQAKWWTQGDEPGVSFPDGTAQPWQTIR